MGVGRAKRMVGIAVLAIALFPGEAGVAQQLPSVPSLPSTPPVQAPSTPSLPAPDVSAPEVPVPDVSVPNVPAPDVSAPDVPTPRLPSTPSTPQLPTPDVGTDAVRVPGASSGQASGPGTTGAQAAGAGQGAAAGADGGLADRRRGAGGRRADGAAPLLLLTQRQLVRIVRQRSACLPGLPAAQRRVVVLRSGFGPGAPRARSDVARMLNTGVRRVARLEQQALTALGTDGPGAACSTAPALVEIASAGVFDLLGLDEGPFNTTDAGSDATAGVAGQSETGGGSQSESQSATTPVSRLPLGLPAGSAAQLGWLFVVVMVVFFTAGVLKELFSRRDARSTPELVARRR
jgi:hypothetical protein